MTHEGTHYIPQSPPEGWYPEPKTGVGQRYWDGERWTEHVYVSGQQYTSPIVTATTEKKAKTRIYWSNLFRVRVWWFSLLSPVVILFLLSLVGLPAGVAGGLYLPLVAIVGAFWMTQQMACRECRTALRVTRLSGGQQVCHKCGAETDRSRDSRV